MNAPPSAGQLTCCGSCEIVVSLAVTSARRTHRGSIASALSGEPAYRSGRRKPAVGSIFNSTSRRTRSSVSRNMNRARSIVPNRLHDHREAATLHAREQQRRPAGRVHAALDLRHFEPGIDFGVDAHELAVAFQVVDTFSQRAVAHKEILTTETRRAQREQRSGSAEAVSLTRSHGFHGWKCKARFLKPSVYLKSVVSFNFNQMLLLYFSVLSVSLWFDCLTASPCVSVARRRGRGR